MKCLIVEDNILIQNDYIQFMRDMGYACEAAETVARACYLLKTHDFDIILLDFQVSDGNTLPIAEFIDVTGRPAVVILITGTGAFPNGESTAISPRIDYVFRKPVNLSDLSALVDYTAGRQRTGSTIC